MSPSLMALEALGSASWGNLQKLSFCNMRETRGGTRSGRLDAPSARALAAALRRMPALRALELHEVLLPRASAAAFPASSGEDMPRLRSVTAPFTHLTPRAVRALAATGWRLEELDLEGNSLGAAGLAVLIAAPSFAIRRLFLANCNLDTTALHMLLDSSWPLEELNLARNNFSAAAAGSALAALSRLRCLRKLRVGDCGLTATGFKALVEATWPTLTCFAVYSIRCPYYGPLGAAAFAGFPAIEELTLWGLNLGEAGARLLANRRWPRLRKLDLFGMQLGAAGVAALARGEWPALQWLNLQYNGLPAPLTLEKVRRWAPVLEKLITDVVVLGL